jgi:cytochrome c oxidase subunit 1
VLLTAKKGVPATDAVWDEPEGLEWTVPSPAPFHTFDTPPETLPALKQDAHA